MKVTKTVYLYGEYSNYTELKDGGYGPGIQWTMIDCDSHHWGPKAAELEVTIEAPDNFDPRPGMIEQLREEQSEILAVAQGKVNEINERINSLLAIECKA